MKQTRRASFVESLVNIGTGFFVGVIANWAVLPWFGYVPALRDSLEIAGLFSVVSVARSYVVRRLFEALRVSGLMA